MRTLVYLPIYKVRADYMVRQGRAWSALEQMVLWKLANERANSVTLAELAGVPLRLIVECVIELIRAGWVTIHTGGDGVSFEGTDAGRKVSQMNRLPENIRRLRRSTALCMDRLSGTFFEPDDLTLVHRESLAPDALVLRPRLSKLVASPEGAVDRLYTKEDEAFEEWVDCRVSSVKYFAAVVFNGHSYEGLPSYAPPALRNAIHRELSLDTRSTPGINGGPVGSAVETRLETADGYSSASVHPDDFVIGGDAHFECLKGVFERAQTFVLVHTCFVGPSAVRRLLPIMEVAAARGVQIDLLWGQRNEGLDEKARQEFLIAKSMFDKLNVEVKPRIRFAERETGSHAKVVLADSGHEGAYEAYVGSCNWLSSLFRSIEVSIRVREPRVIGTIAGALATLRIHPSKGWDADVYRLSELRDKCRKASNCAEGTHSVAVVRDREHLAAVREARDSAKLDIFAVCDLLGPAGETSVFIPTEEAASSGARVLLVHNNLAKSVSPEKRETYEKELAEKDIELRTVSGVHSKFLTWDNDAILVTSFNWLATTPDPWKPRGAEIGILVKGPGLVETVKSRFWEAVGTRASSSDDH
ncbi:hypothetical protein E3H11_10465 [Bradyrhizobium brasilense]|uniref:hypothetical protein n=1 Tax=Bradyrhizobium brasilense TaxID=1419277 RepID=UPI0014572966|nr:hypothetical protein [Bradyrhizobium brasilense]NLS69335.1 hypothetical protein [Bradyrhizobium brasilense]